MSIRTNLVGTIVVAAALLVPVAHADDWARDRIEASGVAGSTHPDNRAEARGPGAIAAAAPTTSGAARPDDRGDTRGPGAVTASRVPASAPNDFDWRDAAIGGLGGLGLALVLAGGLFLVVSQRGRARVA